MLQHQRQELLTSDLKTVVQLSETFKYIICPNCLQRAKTTGEVYRRALFKTQDITKGFDREPKKIYTDINQSVSYSENNHDLPYRLNTNTYFKRL